MYNMIEQKAQPGHIDENQQIFKRYKIVFIWEFDKSIYKYGLYKKLGIKFWKLEADNRYGKKSNIITV